MMDIEQYLNLIKKGSKIDYYKARNRYTITRTTLRVHRCVIIQWTDVERIALLSEALFGYTERA